MRQDLETQTALLLDLGLTKLQARVYLSLLRASPRTGYQVAKELNEPVANTYKALESLRRDGLALVEESARVKAYAGQPISLYLDQRERWFSRKRELLENSLKSLVPSTPGEGFYKVESAEQLYALASSLVGKARDAVAVDATALPLGQVHKDLRKAAQRGRNVLVKSYRELEIPGCTVVFSREMGSPVSDLPIHFLHLVVPGEGYIIAITDLENSRLLHGVYVRNLFLSILAYNGFTMEFFVTRAFNMIHRGRSGDDVLKEWGKLRGIAASRTSAWGDMIKSLGLARKARQA